MTAEPRQARRRAAGERREAEIHVEVITSQHAPIKIPGDEQDSSSDVRHCRRRVTMSAMRLQRFRAVITAGPRGRAVIEVPFNPDETWGAKAEHPVGGTIDGRRVRGTLSPGTSGWALTVGPMWLRDTGVAIGGDVTVELAPEGPQRDDLAGDIATALAANPAAGAFFDTLAQFYRKAYLRWIDATTRRPDVRAARIAEVVDPLAAGIKERPRS